MYVRFSQEGRIGWGILQENRIQLLEGDLFGEHRITDTTVDLRDVRLLAPCTPSKVVCVGLNYRDHARELDLDLPEEPLLFMKPSTSVIGPGETVLCPESSERVDYEAELAVVIGKKARRVSVEESKEYVFGYTCANDVTARDLQQKDGQWTRAKSFDTFCPLGPGIVRDVESDAEILLRVNGEIRQRSRIDQLIFSVDRLIHDISHVMTLLPGDVILTGTPAGVGPLMDGDEVQVEIEGIGKLNNPVKKLDRKEIASG